jgi:SAM-dependent MidA family methyltransferase
LTHPGEMGTLFKVMALAPQDAPLPPALEPVP